MSDPIVGPLEPLSDVYDSGMQPERTAMAWRRTIIAVGIGALVAIRLLPPVLGLGALFAVAAGVVTTAAIWVLAVRRGRFIRRELAAELDDRSYALPDGALPLLLALVVSGGAAVGIAYALVSS